MQHFGIGEGERYGQLLVVGELKLEVFQLREGIAEPARERLVIRRICGIVDDVELNSWCARSVYIVGETAERIRRAFHSTTKLCKVVTFRVVLIDRNRRFLSARCRKKILSIKRSALQKQCAEMASKREDLRKGSVAGRDHRLECYSRSLLVGDAVRAPIVEGDSRL